MNTLTVQEIAAGGGIFEGRYAQTLARELLALREVVLVNGERVSEIRGQTNDRLAALEAQARPYQEDGELAASRRYCAHGVFLPDEREHITQCAACAETCIDANWVHVRDFTQAIAERDEARESHDRCRRILDETSDRLDALQQQLADARAALDAATHLLAAGNITAAGRTLADALAVPSASKEAPDA